MHGHREPRGPEGGLKLERWVGRGILGTVVLGAAVVGCGAFGLQTREPPPQTDGAGVEGGRPGAEKSAGGDEGPALAQAPEFTLPDSAGTAVSLDELLATGPAVLVFYRGHW